jgi:chemotaxis protein MotB
MMAFFLLMWLLNMTSEEKRARLSTYFKYFSIYESGGTSWMDKSSEIFNESGESSQKAMPEKYSTTVSDMKEMEQELKAGLMEGLGEARDQVIVDTVEGGVRIQMTDREGSLMFDTGSNRLTQKAREILHVIGNKIKKLPNKISIEGHTDATPYAKSDYSNWELSTERASSARRELEFNGLDPKRIDRVSGYADKDPLIKDNPEDPRNRRISIILKVPYVDVSKSIPKNVTQVINADTAENKDDGRIMLNKFEENLSIIKNGTNGAIKKNEANSVNNDIPVITKDTSGPFIKQGDNSSKTKKPKDSQSLIKNDTSPLLDENKKGVEKRPLIIKELTTPVISTDDLFKK